MAKKKPPSKTKVVKAAEATQKKLDTMISVSQKELTSAIKELEKRIVKQVAELRTSDLGLLMGPRVNLKQAQAIHKSMITLFENQFGKPVRRNVRGWRQATEWIQSNLEDFGIAADFTAMDKTMIVQLERSAVIDFITLSDQAREKIASTMYQSIAAQTPYDALVEQIKGALTGYEDVRGTPLSVYTETYANDAIMNYYNSVHIAKGRSAGLNHYLYVGNVMARTRDFCRKRVNKVYSAGQINSWTFNWQGKRGPALQYRGGWNCRHHWQPVDPQWFK